jgi:hypothetical protein
MAVVKKYYTTIVVVGVIVESSQTTDFRSFLWNHHPVVGHSIKAIEFVCQTKPRTKYHIEKRHDAGFRAPHSFLLARE